MNTTKLLSLVAAAVIGFFAYSAFDLLYNKGDNGDVNINIEAQVLAMPECALRSNMLTVLGAHYGDSSEELNEILQMYSKMKIDAMTKNKSL
jgi:hypothetical protein